MDIVFYILLYYLISYIILRWLNYYLKDRKSWDDDKKESLLAWLFSPILIAIILLGLSLNFCFYIVEKIKYLIGENFKLRFSNFFDKLWDKINLYFEKLAKILF